MQEILTRSLRHVWVLSFCSDLDLEPMVKIREELGRYILLEIVGIVKLEFFCVFFCECE